MRLSCVVVSFADSFTRVPTGGASTVGVLRIGVESSTLGGIELMVESQAERTTIGEDTTIIPPQA